LSAGHDTADAPAPIIGTAKAGRDINVVRNGIGALGIAVILGFGLLMSNVLRPAAVVVIDEQLFIDKAIADGFVSPENAAALQEQLARTQSDLDELRGLNPDWAAEVDKVIEAVNASEPDAAQEAFARLDALIGARRAELRVEEARSKHAQATLLFQFQVSKAEPLLCAAAYLADEEFWYWIDCGKARLEVGNLKATQAAFDKATELAAGQSDARLAMLAQNCTCVVGKCTKR